MDGSTKLSIEVKFDQEFIDNLNTLEDITLANEKARTYYLETAETLKKMLASSGIDDLSHEALSQIEAIANTDFHSRGCVNPQNINVAIKAYKGDFL